MMASQEVVVVNDRTREEYDGEHIENTDLGSPTKASGSRNAQALPIKEATLCWSTPQRPPQQGCHPKLLAQRYQNVYDFGGVIIGAPELVKEGW